MREINKEKIINTGKYIILALIVGVLVGILDALFGRVLLLISDIRDKNYKILVPFLPIAGLVITWMYYKFSKLSLKGMTLVFETGQKKRDDIPLILIPLVMIGTWITHLFGGSAGREGVAVQMGATLSHWIAKKCKIKDDGRLMLLIGMAAGFAGLFQTPLTATFFAMEVIVSGLLVYEALLPALVAAYTASFTSSFLGLEKFQVEIVDVIDFNWNTGIKIVLIGIIFGIVGWIFSFSLAKAKKFSSTKIENPYVRIAVTAIPLALLLIFVQNGRFCGLGTNLIKASFTGQEILYYDWLLKIAFTIITLAIGFQGGEVTPLFSIGASLGCVLGTLLGLPPMAVAALGYAAVFGSATNTLIAPMLIGVEVFGANNMLAFVLVCSVAFIVNGNVSIYSAQKNNKNGLIQN